MTDYTIVMQPDFRSKNNLLPIVLQPNFTALFAGIELKKGLYLRKRCR